MRRLGVLASLIALLLLGIGPAYAATKTIDDPVGDANVGPDIETFTVTNGARTLKFRLDYANTAINPIHYQITMKWGAGARKKCFFGNGSGGAVPYCNADGTTTPPMPCGSFTLADDGSYTVAKLPRSCIKKAADTMKFKVVAEYTGGCLNCLPDEEELVFKDATVWTPRISRG